MRIPLVLLALLSTSGSVLAQEVSLEALEATEAKIFKPTIIRDFSKFRPYTDRRQQPVDTVVRHTICLGTKESDEEHHVCHPDRTDPYNVVSIIELLRSLRLSVHYIIARDGTIYHLVPEERAARHAGHSFMPTDGRAGVNGFSVGIEVVNMPGDDPTLEQARSLRWLLADLRTRYSDLQVVDHRDIREGKQDPTWSNRFQELSADW